MGNRELGNQALVAKDCLNNKQKAKYVNTEQYRMNLHQFHQVANREWRII